MYLGNTRLSDEELEKIEQEVKEIQKQFNNKRYSLEAFRKIVELKGGILLSTEYKSVKDKYLFKCPVCGEEFEKTACHITSRTNKYNKILCKKCSRKYSARLRYKKENHTCSVCGGEKSNYRSSMCSSCYKKDKKENPEKYRGDRSHIDFSGDKNPSWKGGSLAWWKREVIKRDKVCQICGYSGIALEAHHIKSRSGYPELKTDLNNGITLCSNCHTTLHKLFGHKVNQNNLKELKEYINKNLSSFYKNILKDNDE